MQEEESGWSTVASSAFLSICRVNDFFFLQHVISCKKPGFEIIQKCYSLLWIYSSHYALTACHGAWHHVRHFVWVSYNSHNNLMSVCLLSTRPLAFWLFFSLTLMSKLGSGKLSNLSKGTVWVVELHLNPVPFNFKVLVLNYYHLLSCWPPYLSH